VLAGHSVLFRTGPAILEDLHEFIGLLSSFACRFRYR
jgi:hypothetical protein